MRFNKENLPFQVSPFSTNLLISCGEDSDATVDVDVLSNTDERQRVRLVFVRTIAVKFGVSELELPKDIGVGVVNESAWLSREKERHRVKAPGLEWVMEPFRHFFVQGHDGSAEFLAERIDWVSLDS